MLIGFAGKMGSGKTTAANMMKESIRDCRILSFAEPLKAAARLLFLLDDTQLYTMAGKNTTDHRWGRSPREILQILGTECLRHYFPGLWETHMQIRIESDDSPVAIDDVRFESEAAMIRRMGGRVIHIRRGVEVTAGITGHASERGLQLNAKDLLIENIDDLSRLKEKVIDSIKLCANI